MARAKSVNRETKAAEVGRLPIRQVHPLFFHLHEERLGAIRADSMKADADPFDAIARCALGNALLRYAQPRKRYSSPPSTGLLGVAIPAPQKEKT